ncbi:Ig-like domain-containing protein [Actinoplanes sp. N902-109]|uniref:Ig-like domain-containing protein n=1 Tax=Actinoplanes sp. (strain N902-109) TaxID=649831 RepID=UPI0003296518|nr:Ig-like domain-containing protein [Actinoplanes sp. N902-109]AGL20822.1 polysaccharide deacetylase [Actinoplanes sp. N902-109]
MRTTIQAVKVVQLRLILVAVLLITTALLSAPAWQPEASASEPIPARAPVTVSLTYDDGTDDQLEAADIMAQHGVTGTFYLNSSRFGAPGRLNADEARALQSAGNEIGGHSVTHADLPTLTADEQKRQICNDRSSLLAQGLRVTNFAYPYGDDSPETQQIVAACGYNSARVVGDIVSPGSCSGCPFAEQIPPTNRYSIRTPDSIKPRISLVDMQNYVLQAEQGGGGWVVIVMHRVCDDCDPYAVTPAKLDAFLSWLTPRAADGTVVRTVAEVVGGDVQPSVTGPVPPPRDVTAGLLHNQSMDADTSGDGIPDCWQRGGYGDNSWAWANSSTPHSAPAAMQVSISSFTSGDRRIMTPQDLGACAPEIVPGHTYQMKAWYQSVGTSRLVAYYRDKSNRWVYLSQGPFLAPAATWRETTWTTPELPDAASALSVGLSLRSTGRIVADDFSLTDTDQIAPTVELTSPVDGSRMRGTVTVAADAADASGVDHVDFLLDGVLACSARSAPYRCTVDTTAHPDTVIAITARAVDTAGNTALSLGRNYTISNSVPPDSIAPSVTLAGPDPGSSVSQTVTLSAVASDNDSVSRVLFYVDGAFVAAVRSEPYTVQWDSSAHPDGPATIEAKALDISGNLGFSLQRTVTVDNYRLDSTTPVTTMACDGTVCGADWYAEPVQVSFAATDTGSGVEHVAYTLDGTDPAAGNGSIYSEPFTVSSSATVKYRAMDRAGNLEAVHAFDLAVDSTAPEARVAAPAAGDTVSAVTYLKAAVADSNGVARVYFYLDGKLLGSRIVTPFQWKWDPATVSPGTHTVQVTAVDPARNQTKSEAVTFTVS